MWIPSLVLRSSFRVVIRALLITSTQLHPSISSSFEGFLLVFPSLSAYRWLSYFQLFCLDPWSVSIILPIKTQTLNSWKSLALPGPWDNHYLWMWVSSQHYVVWTFVHICVVIQQLLYFSAEHRKETGPWFCCLPDRTVKTGIWLKRLQQTPSLKVGFSRLEDNGSVY